MSIAEQLKKKRIELQMSQEVAADKAGISRRTLAYYETGEHIPNAETLLILCNLYGLNVNELINKDIEESDKSVPEEDKNNEILEKIDRYLSYQQEKKDNFKRGAFTAALVISIVVAAFFGVLLILKFVLMNRYDYSFSKATASVWTSLLEAMIQFVNDPELMEFPVVSVAVFSIIGIGWITYGIIRLVRHLKNK